ncbi:MAG: sensor histidine kinase [Luteibaculaceae bacterium]
MKKDNVIPNDFYEIETDLEGKYTYFNEKFANSFSKSVLLGSNSMDSIYEEDHALCYATIEKCLKHPHVRQRVLLRKFSLNGELVTNHWDFIFIPEEGKIKCVGYTDVSLLTYKENLERANFELLKVKSELDILLKSVAHDLRTPLAGALSIIEIINHDNFSRFLPLVAQQIISAEQKIATIIKKIKQDNGINRVALSGKSLKSLVLNIFERSKSACNNSAARITLNFEETLIIFQDKILLESIFENLISNSFKYKKNEEDLQINIEFSVKEDREHFNLIYSDNGIGIDLNNNKDKLFKPFQDYSEGKNSIGLGLYLIKMHTETLGGSLNLESFIGKGTTFEFSIPITNEN